MLWAQGTKMMRAGRHEYLAADAAMEMERGSPLKAVHRWEAVLHEQPDNLYAEAELARAWTMVGDRVQASERYQSVILKLIRSGDRREAAARYEEADAESAAPTLPAAEQLALASALEETGKYQVSHDALQKLVSEYPAASECETARLRLASLLVKRLNRPDEAKSILVSFLAEYPDSTWKPFAEDQLRSIG